MTESRHIITIRLDEYSMRLFFQEGATFRCMIGVPTDALFLGCYANPMTRCIEAQFEHESFPECPMGGMPQARRVAYEVLEHPMAQTHDIVPLKIGMDYAEFIDMRKWICERAAEIEGRDK